MAKVKCPRCSTMNEKEKAIQYKDRRYYCPSCLKEKIAEAEAKKSDWDRLFNYIVELYGRKPTGMMYKQLGEYRKKPYEYKDSGMLLSLKYFHETLGNPVKKDAGLGIIPYIYEKAKESYIKAYEINQTNLDKKYNDRKTYIKVKPTKNIKRHKTISFDDLINDLVEDSEVENE